MNKETIEIMWVNVNIQGKEKKKKDFIEQIKINNCTPTNSTPPSLSMTSSLNDVTLIVAIQTVDDDQTLSISWIYFLKVLRKLTQSRAP